MERWHVLVTCIDGNRLQRTYLLHDATVLIEVNDTEEFHVVGTAFEHALLNDYLLVGDAVLYTAYIDKGVE